MILTISGLPGSGKSSVSKTLAKKLKIKRYSLGKIFRREAKDRGLTKLKLARLSSINPKINKIMDKKLKHLIKNQKNFILDSRLAAKIYKKAKFKIYLHASEKIRAQRISERDSLPYKEALKQNKIREKLEIQQYKKQYRVDYRNKKLYNIIINTSKLTVEQTVEKLINIIKKNKSK